MNKKEKRKLIQKVLEEFFPYPEVPLQHRDPYTLLIAVLLSAQCTDARVNLVTPVLFSKADTPEKMVRLSIREIEEMIRTCGLAPTKARAIWHLSVDLLEKFKGEVPKNFEDLESLPGVGHKTASVVMSQAFHIPAFPVDTHIHRLAKRWGLSKGKSVRETEKDLKAIFPKSQWNKVHLQMIYYARRFCPALRHQVTKCPICHTLENEE